MAGAEIMSMAYGIEVQEKDDPYVQMAEEALGGAAACLKTGAYLVDMFPISEATFTTPGVFSMFLCSEVHSGMDAWCQIQAASTSLEDICVGYARRAICGLQETRCESCIEHETM